MARERNAAVRLQVVPTPAGGVFLVMLGALFLMAVNYTNNLVFALVFVLAAAAAVSAFAARRNLAGVLVAVGEAAPVFAGQAATLPVRLVARGRTRHALRVGVAGAAPAATVTTLAPAGERVVVPLAARARGEHRVGRLRLSSLYPAGLFEARIEHDCDACVLVWPQLRPAPPAPAAAAGNAADSLAGLRAWHPGDPLRRIHWKVYARTGQLHVREFEGAAGAHAVTVDWAGVAGEPELRLGQLAQQVLAAEAEGVPHALRLPGLHGACGRGPAHRDASLRALALFDPGAEGAR
jgi:uncharacterized protein (DUF58 family)